MPHPVPDFPRGGSSVLTPLEYRVVADQAMKDSFLSEPSQDNVQSSSNKPQKPKKRQRKEEEGEDVKNKTNKKANIKNKKSKMDPSSSMPGHQVEIITPKKLLNHANQSSFKTLGAVKEIHEYEMIVSLPNGLVGAVAITEISNILNGILEVAAESPNFDESMMPSLSKMFNVGEFITVSVLQSEEEASSDTNKRSKIPLTINPVTVNQKLQRQFLKKGMALPGTIQTIEDRGHVIDIGIKNLTGFISKSTIQKMPSHLKEQMIQGNVKIFSIESLDERVVQLKVLMNDDMAQQDLTEIESLTPGTKIKTVFEEKSDSGVIVKLTNVLKGTIATEYLGNKEDFKHKEKGEARVLFVDLQRKKIGLILTPHVMNLVPFHFNYPFGKKLNVQPISLNKHTGLTVVCEDLVRGNVLPSRLPQMKSKALQNMIDNATSTGTSLTARVVGFDYLSGMVTLTMQSDILEQEFISYSEISFGQVVKGKITKVSDMGVNISINDFIHGFIPKIFLSDVSLSNPSLKFKVNSEVTCRVMSVDVEKKRLILSSKKSLIETELPQCGSIEQMSTNMITLAVVKAIIEHGVILSFLNNLTAFIPKHELNNETEYFAGQTVKCRIIHVDVNSGKIKASLRLRPQEANIKVKVGEILKAKVTKKLADSIIVKAVESKETIVILKPLLSDFNSLIDRKYEALSHGQELQVLVSSIEGGEKIYGTLKQSLINFQDSQNHIEWKTLQDKYPTIVPGTISKIMDGGCVVFTADGSTTFVPKKDISDKYVLSVADACQLYSTVIVKMRVDEEKQRRFGSIKRSDILNAPEMKCILAESYLMTYLNDLASLQKADSDISIGDFMNAEVTEMQTYGAVLNVKGNRKGIIMNDHLEVELKVGKNIQTQVLDVDNFTNILDLAIWSQKKVKPEKPQENESYEAKIMIIKDNYLIVRVPSLKNCIVMVGVVGYNRTERLQNVFQPQQMIRVKMVSLTSSKKVPLAVLIENESKPKMSPSELLKNPIDVTLTSMTDLKPGRLIQVAFRSLKDFQLNVRISDNFHGRIHASELGTALRERMSALKPGEMIEAKVLGFFNSKTHTFLPISHNQGSMKNMVLELTTRDSDLAKPNMELGLIRETIETLVEGNVYDAVVNRIEDKYLLVSLTPTLMGRVSRIDCEHDLSIEDVLTKSYSLRQLVRVKLLKKNISAKSLDLSIKEVQEPFTEGQRTTGEVKKIIPEKGIIIDIASNQQGFVHITDLDDKFEANPTSKFNIGQMVRCYIKHYTLENGKNKCILSLRPSRVLKHHQVDYIPENSEINTIAQLKENDVVCGYIQSVADCGVFVALSRSVIARVKIADLSDNYIKEFQKEFKVGQLVRGMIKTIANDKVDLSLKMRDIDPSQAPTSAEELEIGVKYSGKITSIQKYGLFVKLNNSKLSGLVHKTEIFDSDSDKKIEDLASVYKVGDHVNVVVLSIGEGGKIKLGMKPSYFGDEAKAMDVDEDDQIEQEDEPQDKKFSLDVLDVGFDWGISSTSNKMDLDSDEEDSDEEEGKSENSSKKTKRQKMREQKEKEEKAREIELNVFKEPESADDFERLLLGSPNSSFIWIKYMAFELKLAEIDKARAIAERAIKAINHQDQRERFNVWVAYMNLENAFGTRDTLDECFKRAAQLNDAKKTYIQICQILENSGKIEASEEYYELMVKKFKESCKVWVAFGHFYLKRNKYEDFRKVMERSLKCLPQRKHLKTMLKYTQLEFKEGSVERGRTMFEGLLSKYPKRVDLWNVYLDLEIKQGNQNMVRRLFERSISLKLSSKKMKFFFKKYLEYEKAHGSPEQVEHVKQAALDYVEKLRA